MRSLRLALIVNLAPRKLGSLEDWLVAMASEARRRNHRLDVFGREPVHPAICKKLTALGVAWDTVDNLERSWRRTVPLIARHYDVVHLTLFAPRSRMALIAYGAWPTRVLFVDHHSAPSNEQTAGHPAVIPFSRRLLDRVTMIRVAGLAGVSKYVRDRDIARFGMNERMVRSIYNGVDVKRFNTQPKAPNPDREIRILTAAYLIRDKGVDYLLGALAKLRADRTRLFIAGDGPDEDHLKRIARKLAIEARTEFLGLRDDLPSLLMQADIFVHPAIWHEAFGLTVAEAMASGCPVVASAVGAIPELIEDGESGLLVPPRDEVALAHSLQRLISEPDLRFRLGANARRRVLHQFSLQSCVQQHMDWCEDVGG